MINRLDMRTHPMQLYFFFFPNVNGFLVFFDCATLFLAVVPLKDSPFVPAQSNFVFANR